MGEYLGRSAVLKFGAITFNRFTTIDSDESVETVDRSAGGDAHDAVLSGLAKGQFTLNVNHNASDVAMLDALEIGAIDILEYYPEGQGGGKPKYIVTALVQNRTRKIGYNDLARLSVTLRAQEDVIEVLYQFSDLFTMLRLAGAVNGTAAEPGPGTRAVVDTSNYVDIYNTEMVLRTGKSSYTDPIVAIGEGVAREAGNVWAFQFRLGVADQLFDIGLSLAANARGYQGGIHYSNTAGVKFAVATTEADAGIGLLAANTNYVMFVVVRATGAFVYLYGGAYTRPTLVYAHEQLSGTPVYPYINLYVASRAVQIGEVSLCKAYMQAPFASDGFGGVSAATDGLGHPEGAGGGVGAGGGGVAWIDAIGTWTAASGTLRPATFAGGVAHRLIDTGATDYVVRVLLKASDSANDKQQSIIVRWVDENNYIYARNHYLSSGYSFDNAIYKVVDGVHTLVTAATAIYYKDSIATVRVSGDTVTHYTNDNLRNTYTITDAVLRTGTKVGLRSDAATHQFDNFQAYKLVPDDYQSLAAIRPMSQATYRCFVIGDSKSTGTLVTGYLPSKVVNMIEEPAKIAVGGSTVVTIAAEIDADLAARAGSPDYVLLNLGANDVAAATTESAFKTALAHIMDAVHAKYPIAKVYLMHTWVRNGDTYCNAAATWRADVIAAGRSAWAFTHGELDERVYLKGADNGATYTSDGIHPTDPAGNRLMSRAWRRALLGFE